MSNKKGSIEKTCKFCQKLFYIFPYRIKEGSGHFCSKKCYWDSMKKEIQKECRRCKKIFS